MKNGACVSGQFSSLIASAVTPEKRYTESGPSFCEEKQCSESDQYIKDFENQLLYWPVSLYPSLHLEEKPLLLSTMQVTAPKNDKVLNVELSDALALAKKAVLASKEAASLAEEANLPGDDFSESFSCLESSSSAIQFPLEEKIKVKSGRLLERRSKKRGVSKSKELARLEEVKQRLQSQFGTEPTLIEWAEAVGVNCLVLQSHIHKGNRSREKMTYANFRLVVHVAKRYQGWGMNLQDLLQEGSKGLMRSIEKFKPQAGCRFSTYSYWWIRQSIRKAIFQNSRTIRLPENVYNTLRQVRNAKKQCIQEGYQPSNEELARRMGMTVEKLMTLFASTKTPLSMQQPVWAEQDTTFQEITADTEIERPDQVVAKQLMRQHLRNFLNILSPKERRIIRLRFGIEDGKQNSLSQIGTIFGISKERVRQLESRALDKLRKCLSSQGLEAYAELLI
ncbi:hypothetical protein IFM89_025925 [Coptis chinensis]|uniref:RNA polymerase sigma-70 domain-containing protein n=1 Tax=Coptis chinensis TaxID=261450 RepID=A0A835LNV0_9MAGN|nr:hypothetical protein IFM89_025925 [Coptis chinensis]